MTTTLIAFPRTKFELEFNQGSVYSDEERDAILRVFASNAPSCGSEVLSFEKEFAEFNHATFAIAVGNATQGLEIAIRATVKSSHVNHADPEVIVPSISWISTASSAALAGATVKFADVLSPTICIDPESVKRLVTTHTVAVVVVHLYGRPVDGLIELAGWLRERNILLIEDCAHAIAAVDSSGIPCGSIGDIGVFSFHQQKNMVTLGEGGMCVTSNPKLRELMIGFRSLCAMSYDPKGKYLAIDAKTYPMGNRYWMMDFADHGHNFRMLDMQAAVGRAQLRKVKNWNARRAEIARQMNRGLSDICGLCVASVDDGGHVHSWHIFHILITEEFPVPKEQFMWAMLQDFGIKVWSHYSPMHLASSFRSSGLGRVGDCPVAEQLFEQFVSLPLHPRLTDEAVAYMIDAVRQIAERPYVTRSSPTPLLDALLGLSATKSPETETCDEMFSPIVQHQLGLFQPQVKAAIQDGFFVFSPKEDGEDNSSAAGVTAPLPPILISRAPGRLDLMGGNDDYTGGLVFECTIAEATFVAAQAVVNPSGGCCNVVVRNRQLCEEDIAVPVSVLRQSGLAPTALADYLRDTFPASRWPLYVVGVLLWLQMHHTERMFDNGRQGLALLVWSEVPLNRGVSSSASVEVAVMKAAAKAFGIDLGGEALATACQWVENQVCASACGIMDQMAVTLGGPFMAMKCQPANICAAPPLPNDLTVFALDSGVSHEISGIEYEAARAAAFMGYKIICELEGLEILPEEGQIPRYTDLKYNGYLANMSPSVFARRFEKVLPETITGHDFLQQYGLHVDPATSVLVDHIYHVRANTKYAVLENNRVTNFYQLLKGCHSEGGDPLQDEVYVQLGELMYQSHDAYTECGLGSAATSVIVDLVRELGPTSGLFGAKITGGGAGGTVAVLGRRSATELFQRSIVETYARQRGLQEAPHVFVGSSPGADAFGIREFK